RQGRVLDGSDAERAGTATRSVAVLPDLAGGAGQSECGGGGGSAGGGIGGSGAEKRGEAGSGPPAIPGAAGIAGGSGEVRPHRSGDLCHYLMAYEPRTFM